MNSMQSHGYICSWACIRQHYKIKRKKVYNQGALLEGIHDEPTTLIWIPQHGVYETIEQVTSHLVKENSRQVADHWTFIEEWARQKEEERRAGFDRYRIRWNKGQQPIQ